MTETRALLITDVVDSTRLAEQLGDAAMAERWLAHDRVAGLSESLGDAAMAERWLAHDRVARDLLEVHREIDKPRGSCSGSSPAADAVACALRRSRWRVRSGTAASSNVCSAAWAARTWRGPGEARTRAFRSRDDGGGRPTSSPATYS